MISFPTPAKILEKKGNKGVFEIEALYPGYGVTMGNSLRRVLLSSLEGAAATQIKTKGANHEFSTIPGVVEDMISIILNVKQMRFRLHGQEPQTATLKVKGEKEITASDFTFPAQVELISKELPIAHCTDKATELEMEILIEHGVGYLPVSVQRKEKQGLGIIALDAIFTPVRNVSWKVERMRVGERTDFDRLRIDIETDGTMDPEVALRQAIDLLGQHYQIIGEGLQGVVEEPVALAEKPAKKEKKEKPAKAASKKKK